MDVLNQFERFVERDVAAGDASPATVRVYLSHVRDFCRWCQEQEVELLEADEEAIRDYRAHLIAQYARSSVASHLSVLRRLFDMLTERELRDDNPVVRVRAPRQLSAASETRRWFRLAEIKKLLDIQRQDSDMAVRDTAIIELMIFHGPRVAEVAGLDVADYDHDQVEVVGKGNKHRRLLLIPRTKRAIDAWLAVRARVASPGEDALFVSFSPTDRGSRLSVRGVRFIVDRHLVEAGIKRAGASCHSLRHSFATLARAAGARLDAIGRALGHADPKTTQIYADIVDKEKRNPARHLEAALLAQPAADNGD
jgi:integrase/recombinase XerD